MSLDWYSWIAPTVLLMIECRWQSVCWFFRPLWMGRHRKDSHWYTHRSWSVSECSEVILHGSRITDEWSRFRRLIQLFPYQWIVIRRDVPDHRFQKPDYTHLLILWKYYQGSGFRKVCTVDIQIRREIYLRNGYWSRIHEIYRRWTDFLFHLGFREIFNTLLMLK